MTAIVAHRDGWMVADSQVTFGMTKGPFHVNKIINLGHTLIGVAGCAAVLPVLEKNLARKSKDKVLRIISEMLSDKDWDSQVLVVQGDRTLTMVDGRGALFPLLPTIDYWSIGSGASECIGYLAATRALVGKVTTESAQTAIRFSATIDIGVNDILRVEKLKKKK